MKQRLFEQVAGTYLLKNFPHFIETGISLPLSKQQAITSYPESEHCSQYHISLLRDPYEYYSPTYAKVIKVYPFLRFSHKNPICTYLFHIHTTNMPQFFLPYLITLIILAGYKTHLYLVSYIYMSY